MTDIHARACARELPWSEADQAAAIHWIDEELATRKAEGTEAWRSGPSTDVDLFSREFVVAAFLTGREQSWLIATLGRATALMADCVALFRRYEGEHVRKLEPGGRDWQAPAEVCDATRRKAETNREIAERLEAFLLDPDVPQDRVSGPALTLVQDLGALMAHSGGVYGLHRNDDPAPWESLTAGGGFEDWLSSYDRLRDELDRRYATSGALPARREDAPEERSSHPPVANRVEVRNVGPITDGPLADPAVVEGLMESAGLVERSRRPTLGTGQLIKHPDPRFDPDQPVTINGFRYYPAQVSVELRAGLVAAIEMVDAFATRWPEELTEEERARYNAIHALCHGTSDAPTTEE